MRYALFATLLLISLTAAPLANADGTQPSFDCLKASSSAEELVCADAKLAALDRRLAARFAAALDAARGIGSGSDAAVRTLRATQRGWIKGRDDCWKANDVRACVAGAYLTREGVLVAQWMLEEPAQVARYACNGNPANEVTAMFFDTENPSVRIEYGDSIDTGILVRSASGNRFEASFGRFLWTKGRDAIFAWQEADEMRCTQK